MTRKAIFLVAALTFVAFVNTLGSHFTGDAYSLFVENHFYEDSANVSKVFSKRLVMGPDELNSGFVTHPTTNYSGFVSYRPITALSFFLDYAIWGKTPFGYHLTNLLLHILTTLLVYLLALGISKATDLALLVAILFGIHPIQAEVVNSIGYRSDSLVVLFYLSTILAYRKFRTSRSRWRKIFILISALCFFLALFSKESALSLPFLLILYDYWFLFRGPPGDFLRLRLKVYLPYMAVFIFYLIMYFNVMANIFYSHFRPLSADAAAQIKILAEILFRYLEALFLPWRVTVLPPLYAPTSGSVPMWHICFVVIFIVGAIIFARGQFKKNRANTFAVIWFFVTYLPTANLLTLLNPFAFRFMYLPSIGFFLATAWGIDHTLSFFKKKNWPINLATIFKIALVGTALSVTIPLNLFFKNNIVTCREMIRVYPSSSRPYWLLGLIDFKEGEYDQALAHLQRYLDNPPNLPFIPNPRGDYAVYHLMGRSYVDDPDCAIQMFYKVIELNPKFALVYVDLAKAYILKNDFEDALNASLTAIAFEKDLVPAYVYTIHSYWALGQMIPAKEWLAKGLALAPQDSGLLYLKSMMDQNESR